MTACWIFFSTSTSLLLHRRSADDLPSSDPAYSPLLSTKDVLPRFLLLRPASDPNGDDEQDDADHAELAELVTAEEAQNGQARERQEAKAKADNVARVCHPAMPGVRGVELLGRRDIEEEIAK